MGKTLNRLSRWHGRGYDLGRMTLRQLWRAYLTYPAIQLYAALALIAFAVALGIARHWRALLVPPLCVVVIFPLVEYALHRFILHQRFLYKMRFTAALWKRIHFDHHQDPHLLEILFGDPANLLPTVALISLPIGYLIAGWPGAASAFGAALIATCVYEFVHCIAHLNYKPKNPFLLKLKQHHLAHHFYNETGNYGITSIVTDRLMGTFYQRAGRARSATVFNLGYDIEQARRYPAVMELTGSPPRARPAGRAAEP